MMLLLYCCADQEHVGEDGVLEAGVHQGVEGREAAGGDAVQVVQEEVPHILDPGQVHRVHSCREMLG